MKLDFLDKYEYFTGVPDSLLSPLCNYLFDKYGIGDRHIIAANEGNAVGLAAGYHLATGKTPVVYLQNSGLGNIINPVAWRKQAPICTAILLPASIWWIVAGMRSCSKSCWDTVP